MGLAANTAALGMTGLRRLWRQEEERGQRVCASAAYSNDTYLRILFFERKSVIVTQYRVLRYLNYLLTTCATAATPHLQYADAHRPCGATTRE
jgi:hypothetical protein